MIVQCSSCKTKFRFDEALIKGAGVWLRCSRCGDVFFLEDTHEKTGDVTSGLEAHNAESETVPAGTERPGRSAAEELPEDDIYIRSPQEGVGADDGAAAPTIRERRWPGVLASFLGSVVVLVLAGYLFLFFTTPGQLALKETATYLPVFGIAKEVGPAQVKLAGLQQRYVMNWILGNVRVVEGVVINHSKYPMTRISVRARLYDANGAILAERVSFAGNLFTDEEIGGLTEEEMEKQLNQPRGTDFSNDRIEAMAQVPFMIIFPREPVGVAKTKVTVVGAER
ncbi:MAG: DUF3426 domain-containing protein, partial [Smithellaceae bacterium]|nr:DUF3426 domain-containing protein [Smithellaceae bacterium]